MKKVVSIGVVALLLGMGQLAFCDVTVTRQMTTSMFGMPANELTMIEQYQGTKSRNVIQYEAPETGEYGQPSEIYITLPENGTISIVDEGLRTYEEFPLSVFAEMIAMTMDEESDNPFLWTPGIQKQEDVVINDLKCTGAIITVTGSNSNDTTEKIIITYEQWITDNIPAIAEIKVYQDKFREVTDLDPDQQQWVIDKMITPYCPDINVLMESSGKLQGFPVKMSVTVEVISDPSKTEGDGDQVSTLVREAAAMARYLMNQTGEETGSSPLMIFSYTSELLGISTEAIDKSLFEIPEGYEKQ